MPISNCPICSGSEQNYLFAIDGMLAHRCAGCGLVGMTGDARPATLLHRTDWAGYETEADAGERYAQMILKLRERGNVLLVCDEPHPIGKSLRAAQCEVVYCKRAELKAQEGSFGSVVFLFSLEHIDDPAEALDIGHRLLLDGGVLFIATPAMDSVYARRFGRSWIHWRNKNHWYFSRSTMQLLLERHGFRYAWFEPDRRIFGLEHCAQRLQDLDWLSALRAVRAVTCILPAAVTSQQMRLRTSGLLVTALKVPRRTGTKLSIIMPVFNERATVATTLSAVLAKELEGIDEREIVVVESNSSDGTRDIVKSFEGTPGLKIIYEDAPRGKGHAVRTGFLHATGDIILIQDADIEYDINDYDELLKPLLQWRQLFVLGSRHQGNWKMRKFTDQPALALLFNFGQILFTWLMNTLYEQKMSDPFTMYKVFRRECLFGLNFECNRFDFDHELVIKLLLKGYQPFEIPVNYWSRSYSQGKKVTIVGDPLLWIRANFKFRFISPFLARDQAYGAAKNSLAKARFASKYSAKSGSDKLNFEPDVWQSLNFEPDKPASKVPAEHNSVPGTGERSV